MDGSVLGEFHSEGVKVPSTNTILTDVIEVIGTDPDFKDIALKSNMFNGGGEVPTTQQPSSSSQSAQQIRRQAQIRIVEQPASKALRFRYECEGRSAGSIPGVSSTSDNKTFPTIQIVGYQGRAVVVVSCVTKDPPHRPHPHNLVGREGCKKGVCTLEIPTDTMTVQFSNLGIQCVKKKDIEQALKVREEIRVDPFRTGFSHRNQPTTIDLNAVRLCFQVFLEGNTPGKFSTPLNPVMSDPIYDKKAMNDLSIFKLSHCTSSVDGGKNDIILLCEKVAKEDIQVRFYEENGDWEAFADFQPTQVYKQHAIWFKTPKYKTLDVTEPVKVLIQLRRPSDNATSDPLPFELLPLDSEPGAHKRKRKKIENPTQILRLIQEHDTKGQLATGFQMETIKIEPRDATSPYQGGYAGISTQNPSPSHHFVLENDTTYSYPPNLGNPTQYIVNNPQQTWSTQVPLLGQNIATVTVTQPEWNIPLLNGPSAAAAVATATAAAAATAAAIKSGIAASNPNVQENIFYDLDTKQVNSEEIRDFLMKENVRLTDIEHLDLSFSDINVQSQDHNMTDSIERFAKFTIDNIYPDGTPKDNT